jgi:hypothetical protein
MAPAAKGSELIGLAPPAARRGEQVLRKRTR